MATNTTPIQYPVEYHKAAFGDHGFKYLVAAGTSTAGEYFHTIFANEAAVITVTDFRTGTVNAGMVLPAGSALYGCLTTVTCTSGKITCYLKENI